MILVLGGTADAHRIACGLQAADIDFVVSLAGVTKAPVERSYPVRTGGFGGEAGLVEYLNKEEIAAVIDATHPFAERMSVSAIAATAACGLPLIRFERPEWAAPEGADWHYVVDVDAAARALPCRARAFLTVGTGGLSAFRGRLDVWFLVRGIELVANLERNWEFLQQRPPFGLAEELALMRSYSISHLVTKNSGGAQTRAKIDAATELGIPVIVVGRPVLPVVESASTVSDILRWAEKI